MKLREFIKDLTPEGAIVLSIVFVGMPISICALASIVLFTEAPFPSKLIAAVLCAAMIGLFALLSSWIRNGIRQEIDEHGQKR